MADCILGNANQRRICVIDVARWDPLRVSSSFCQTTSIWCDDLFLTWVARNKARNFLLKSLNLSMEFEANIQNQSLAPTERVSGKARHATSVGVS